MTTAQQFLYGLFNGLGIKLYKSPLVDTLLNRQAVERLCHIGDKLESDAIIPQWWPVQQVISISKIHPVVDELGRKGVWNHTILIRIEDFFYLANPVTFLAQHFLNPTDKPPSKLEAVTLR